MQEWQLDIEAIAVDIMTWFGEHADSQLKRSVIFVQLLTKTGDYQ